MASLFFRAFLPGSLRLVPKVEVSRVRFMSIRRGCIANNMPRCSPDNPLMECCAKKPAEPSTWVNPECCKEPCKDVMPRLDDIYYRRSDKSKRLYQQTWVECPRLKILPKVMCCFDQVELPPIKRRCLERKPETACPLPRGLPRCYNERNPKCPRMTMPCCRTARSPPICMPAKKPSQCKRNCTPYPSYSECSRKKPHPRHPIECKCIRSVSMCEVFAYNRYLEQLKTNRKPV